MSEYNSKIPNTSNNPKIIDDDPAIHDYEDDDMFIESQKPIDVCACRWFIKKQAGMNGTELNKFMDWIEADPQHERSFQQFEELWQDISVLILEQSENVREENQLNATKQHAVKRFTIPVQASLSRTGLKRVKSTKVKTESFGNGFRIICRFFQTRIFTQLLVACCAALIVASGWVILDNYYVSQVTFTGKFVTRQGEQKTVKLPDGSHLQLDASTDIIVSLYTDRRQVHIQEGQVFFSVESDSKKPFDVTAGPLRITVTGTRFIVRSTSTGLNAGDTSVLVEEGSVHVESEQGNVIAYLLSNSESTDLIAGQAVVANKLGYLGKVYQPPTDSMASWREGRVSFHNSPLAQAINEFERYGPTGLIIRDPDVEQLTVSGSFDVHRIDAFKRALPKVLPVGLVPRNHQTEVMMIRKME